MSIKLTDTQLVLLSAASQREDQCLTPPTGARLGPAKKAAAKLLEEGLVRELRARKGAPVWGRDGDADRAFALKLTTAGLKAIAERPDADGEKASAGRREDGAKGETSQDVIDVSEAAPGPGSGKESARLHVPRAGTKIGFVIDMLGRDAGATIDELVDATGWLPHTTRAALTGLRKRGFEIDRRKAKDLRAGAYVIVERNIAAQG
jgi:hypothetical protein